MRMDRDKELTGKLLNYLDDNMSAAPHAVHRLADLLRDLCALLESVQELLQLNTTPMAVARLLPELFDALAGVVERVHQINYCCLAD